MFITNLFLQTFKFKKFFKYNFKLKIFLKKHNKINLFHKIKLSLFLLSLEKCT